MNIRELGSIAPSDFLLHTGNKGLNRFVTDEGLVEPLQQALNNCQEDVLPGYRDGVVLLPLKCSTDWMVHDTVELKDGESLVGLFEGREPGEEPRKCQYVIRKRSELPCPRSVFFVLYRADVLEEDNAQSWDNVDWEIVSVITSSLDDEPEPMSVETMLANHFHLSGGTRTNMPSETFVKALETSVSFWQCRLKAQEVE